MSVCPMAAARKGPCGWLPKALFYEENPPLSIGGGFFDVRNMVVNPCTTIEWVLLAASLERIVEPSSDETADNTYDK